MATRLKLGVNIDHVATLRQVRGTRYPHLVEAARLCEKAGAAGITVHLREDRRHIQDADVRALRRAIRTRLNLEMANAPAIVAVACRIVPDEVCIVPEKREELTTEGGLDAAGQRTTLARSIRRLRRAGIAVSLFIDPDDRQIRAAAALGAPVIELHTGTLCNALAAAGLDPLQEPFRPLRSGAPLRRRAPAAAGELARLVRAARLAHELGLQVNAGHGINIGNIAHVLEVPFLDTLNIGHSIVSRAVFVGLNAAVKEIRTAMSAYRGGRREA
jgi:pyridoxine 5-phosphate synthase